MESNTERSHEPSTKPVKKKAKILGATTFAIAKLVERKLNGKQNREMSNIAKNEHSDRALITISHLGSTYNIFVGFINVRRKNLLYAFSYNSLIFYLGILTE